MIRLFYNFTEFPVLWESYIVTEWKLMTKYTFCCAFSMDFLFIPQFF